MRTSEVLRGILTKNPNVQTFSVKRIIATIGTDRPETSLLMFSIPALLPTPSPRGIVTLPTGALACHMLAGKQQVRTLPHFITQLTVSRRTLAVAIHAMLPIIEAAERILRPRWGWINHHISRRAIGLLLFLLAVAIAYPLSGASVLHALSIFVVSLGLAEQDGAAVLLGLIAGVISLAIVFSAGISARVLRSKAVQAMRKLGKQLGRKVLVRFADDLGYRGFARLLTFKWTDVLMSWDPERPAPMPAHPSTRLCRLPADHAFQSHALLLRRSREPIQVPSVASVDQTGARVGEQAGV